MRRNIARTIVTSIAILAIVMSSSLMAAVRLPGFFNDNMILQRDIPAPLWGWADAGEEVTVEFAGQTKTVKTGADGKWMVKLDAMKASPEGRILKIAGKEIKNVVVGDIYICSGQSNMEWSTGGSVNAKEEIENANYPLIRLVTTPRLQIPTPQDDVKAQWEECSPRTIGRFSAVGYFFGRKLHKETEIPIGLINSSWGGSRIEPWIPPEGFMLVPELKQIADQVAASAPGSEAFKKRYLDFFNSLVSWLPKAKAAVAEDKRPPSPPSAPHSKGLPFGATGMYNGKVHALAPFGIRGAIWYQGEANGGEGVEYFHKMQALIGGWRRVWNQGDFPFYFVQLADFRGPNKNAGGGDGWAKHREAQRQSLTIPRTGMAVITDIGNERDIHPKNKQDVGLRLALWALANDYGKKNIVYSGPLYKGIKVEGNKIRVSFDHAGSGLMIGVRKNGLEPTKEAADGKLQHFAVAGADKQWHWADATIDADGKTVLVSCEAVAEPVAVRYAFAQNPQGANLYNKEGLPASGFRTDNW